MEFSTLICESIKKIWDLIKNTNNATSLAIGLIVNIITFYVPYVKNKIKSNNKLKFWKKEENKETQLIRKTIWSSIIGTIISMGIIVLAIVIAIILYALLSWGEIEISDYVIRGIIGLVSLVIFLRFSLKFGGNIRHAPYTFCKYRMSYVLFYLDFLVIILAPVKLENSVIYRIITKLAPLSWVACNVLLSLYLMKVSTWYQQAINVKSKVYLNNVNEWDKYILEALENKEYEIEGEFLIIFKKGVNKACCKIPMSNVKEIKYTYEYNTKSTETIEKWTLYGILKCFRKVITTFMGILIYVVKGIIYLPQTIKKGIKNLIEF